MRSTGTCTAGGPPWKIMKFLKFLKLIFSFLSRKNTLVILINDQNYKSVGPDSTSSGLRGIPGSWKSAISRKLFRTPYPQIRQNSWILKILAMSFRNVLKFCANCVNFWWNFTNIGMQNAGSWWNSVKFQLIFCKMLKKFASIYLNFWFRSGAKDSKGANKRKSCRSRKILKNAPTLAIRSVDTAENELSKIGGSEWECPGA